MSRQMDALLHNGFYGNYGVRVAAAVVFAYLFGSIPIGPTVRWLFSDMDPRIGTAAARVVPFLNVVKGFIPTIIAGHGGGPLIGLCAGLAATLGHYYCPWRRFLGGKNVDVLTGVLLALSPITALMFLAVWAVNRFTTQSVASGTVVASALLLVPMWCFYGVSGAIFGMFAGGAVALRLCAKR